MNLFYIFFFFQAEDGIRDRNVTGVQTCALPISVAQPVAVRPGQRGGNVAALPAARPGQPAPAARPGQPTPARPGMETRQPAAAGHGAPPNMRQGNPAQPAAPNSRPGSTPATATRPGQPAPT